MQSRVMHHPSAEVSQTLLHSAAIATPDTVAPEDLAQSVPEATRFSSHFVDCMEMFAPAQTVATYLDQHHEWFRRCAHPMRVETIGQNSYALIIGQYGSFGYQVEPKIGLDLLPQDAGVYRIETVPIPNYTPTGYDVDFRAAMELVELSGDDLAQLLALDSNLPHSLQVATRVQWQLDLTVSIQFPRFIHALPQAMIQSTGDRVIRQVVRQVSNRLTRKVQEDFHHSHNILLPKRSRRWPFQKEDSGVTLDDATDI